MTDTEDEPAENTTGGDYEYDEAHGGNDDGPDVPAALQEEAADLIRLAGPSARQ
ncbi:hypothetical protein [Actinoplanes couchii]|uniref:Uncharacterized protein n=1 Tax=Actinoplanes couchii TaxID=403638 RepID=A0ABQ3X0S5_9ACTN|nr:hypothetical protein [Actinoplanes couchii]MDR6316506.1 hypothetical protein [Actinoplanes couchii]GID52123.1 hypothetical protein Aco03nite_005270 [Actinoplanes couchii]